jgi:hypothetical protein
MSLLAFSSVDGEGCNSTSLAPQTLMNFVQNSPDTLRMIISSLEFPPKLNEVILETIHYFYSEKYGLIEGPDNVIAYNEFLKPECRKVVRGYLLTDLKGDFPLLRSAW